MKLSSVIISVVIVSIVASCNKTDFNYPDGTVGKSKIIYFPAIQIIGDKITAIAEGTAYNDPGATAVLNGAAVQYTTSTTITAATSPGIYTITYAAANAEGFTASDFRIVAVVPAAVATDPTVLANDFSGTYLRAATGVTSTWTSIGFGAYAVENPGGAGVGVGLYVVAENNGGNSITIPEQDSPYYGGTVSSSGETYNPNPPATYTWVFHAAGYGTGPRTFTKQ